MHRTDVLARIGHVTAEAMLEHQLSERELERLSGVSRRVIHKLRTGGSVRPDLAVRVAATIVVLDLYTPLAALPPVGGNGHALLLKRPPSLLAHRPVGTLGGAA